MVIIKNKENNLRKKSIIIWLKIMLIMVLSMVIIGGYTRLSGSGLSIVEWRPITGILPPLDNQSWIIEFEKYKSSPEYQKINNSISFSDFKYLYYVEYFHRLMGRLTGLVFLLPFFYFYQQKFFDKKSSDIKIKNYLIIALLFFAQGLMGWLMVKSGLVDNPHVSHVRLAAHLSLAMILTHMIIWEIANLSDMSIELKVGFSKSFLFHAILVLFNLYIQIFSGAMVAGLHGGLIYNSFPLMGDNFVPEEWFFVDNVFTNPATVQFIHRIIAYILFCNILLLIYRISKYDYYTQKMRYSIILLVIALFLQISLGILTLISLVEIKLAIAHQFFGVVLSIIYVYVLHSIFNIKVIK